MRCYICDSVIGEPHFNHDHEDFDPCDYCMMIINDLVGGWKDSAFADDDDFGEEDPVKALFLLWDRILADDRLFGGDDGD